MPKVGGVYRYDPVMADKVYRKGWPKEGTYVRACKPAGNIGRVPARYKFVETLSGQFIGMVMSNSLTTLTPAERKKLGAALKAGTPVRRRRR